MLIQGLAINKDITKKYKDEIAWVRIEDTIHKRLKGGRGIGQTKRRDFEFM